MTGFATAETLLPPFRLVWEIRSVNHRFLELGFRLPDEARAFEPECRDLVAGRLKRGKVDCTLKVVAATGELPEATVSEDALRGLRALADGVRAVFPDARPLSVGEVLRSPGVLREPQLKLAALGEPVRSGLRAALDALQAARRREGERIGELLEKRNVAITALLAGARPLLDGVQVRYREKLRERLQRLDVQAQPERIEQELVLLAQRLDVAEEVDRLTTHVAELRDVLARDEPVGRRLDFLIQELNREANTFASKVQDEALTRAAVELKVLIEQMREQVQNLE
ncbi:MAG TPA: YicC/YloC family endoribonuclease [Gammaproteobacteria bacterium]|nr:YicC/YloC family endoribonuclease [Gammaproteobacteria bacterium]